MNVLNVLNGLNGLNGVDGLSGLNHELIGQIRQIKMKATVLWSYFKIM